MKFLHRWYSLICMVKLYIQMRVSTYTNEHTNYGSFTYKWDTNNSLNWIWYAGNHSSFHSRKGTCQLYVPRGGRTQLTFLYTCNTPTHIPKLRIATWVGVSNIQRVGLIVSSLLWHVPLYRVENCPRGMCEECHARSHYNVDVLTSRVPSPTHVLFLYENVASLE